MGRSSSPRSRCGRPKPYSPSGPGRHQEPARGSDDPLAWAPAIEAGAAPRAGRAPRDRRPPRAVDPPSRDRQGGRVTEDASGPGGQGLLAGPEGPSARARTGALGAACDAPPRARPTPWRAARRRTHRGHHGRGARDRADGLRIDQDRVEPPVAAALAPNAEIPEPFMKPRSAWKTRPFPCRSSSARPAAWGGHRWGCSRRATRSWPRPPGSGDGSPAASLGGVRRGARRACFQTAGVRNCRRQAGNDLGVRVATLRPRGPSHKPLLSIGLGEDTPI